MESETPGGGTNNLFLQLLQRIPVYMKKETTASGGMRLRMLPEGRES
jgi:hypothetical protein